MPTPPSFDWTTFLIAPPLTPPFRHRGGVSAFGVRRWRGQLAQVQGVGGDLPSTHAGVDLQPVRDDDTGAVYAAHWGEVVRIDQDFDAGALKQETLTLLCEPPAAGIIFNYLHILRSVTLPSGPASSGVQQGDRVRKGQLLGFISPNNRDPHLHFEMRILADTAQPIDNARPVDTFPIDPTVMLYRFDANRWPRARDQEAYASWDIRGYVRIERLRMLPWRIKHKDDGITFHNAWLLEALLEGAPGGIGTCYLPVEHATEPERALSEMLRDAFRSGHRVRLRGRHSHFFGDRPMIEDIRARP